ncbi:DUF7710 domain-containing protein [Deinococcus enclensis]|uniref:DUF7710 domain-containing protein n=1 Tax=Deinococcus enclensis TaxID=1049582 RepID=UPI003F881DC6
MRCLLSGRWVITLWTELYHGRSGLRFPQRAWYRVPDGASRSARLGLHLRTDVRCLHLTARRGAWIGRHQLSGTLSAYPLDEGDYDWSVRSGHFTSNKPHHGSPEQMARCDSAFLPHVHYLNGQAQAGREEAVALAQLTEEP